MKLPPASIRHLTQLTAKPPPSDCAVYFLCRNNKVVYVGRSLQLGNRLRYHCHYREKRDTVWFLPTTLNTLDKQERRFIRKLRPALNKQHCKRYSSIRVTISLEQPLLDKLTKLSRVTLNRSATVADLIKQAKGAKR